MHIQLREHLPGDNDDVDEAAGYVPPDEYLGCEVPKALSEEDEKGFKLAVNNCLGPAFNVRPNLIERALKC